MNSLMNQLDLKYLKCYKKVIKFLIRASLLIGKLLTDIKKIRPVTSNYFLIGNR